MSSQELSGASCSIVRTPLFRRRLLWNLFLLTTGNILFAIGINAILIPQGFLSGGVVGIAIILHYLFPVLNTGLLYFVLNIPLILLGWLSVSRSFIGYSAYGMVSLSVATAFIAPVFPPIANPILAAIFAGIVCGAGSGITLRSQGSGGGLDILAVYLYKTIGFRIGSTITLVNVIILSSGAYFFGLERTLYSFVFVYTFGRAIDSVLTGFNQRKSIFIISDCSKAIADQILVRLNRGVTYLYGTGAYSGAHKEVIFSIITLTELAKMKKLVFDIDPKAFMVVNDTLEVLGKRHGTRQIY